jgi:hypothetical protein
MSLLYAPISAPTQIEAAFGQGIGLFERYVVVTSSGGAVTIDWATLPVPRATNVQQTSEGLTWSQAAPAAGDARVLNWASQWTDSNQVQHNAYWEVLEPATGGNSEHLPSLPGAYAEDDPTVHVGTLRAGSVWYVDYDNLTDYQAVKPNGVEVMWAEMRMLTTPHRAHVSFGGTN